MSLYTDTDRYQIKPTSENTNHDHPEHHPGSDSGHGRERHRPQHQPGLGKHQAGSSGMQDHQGLRQLVPEQGPHRQVRGQAAAEADARYGQGQAGRHRLDRGARHVRHLVRTRADTHG